MSTIKITYDAKDLESVQKIFEVVRALRRNGLDLISHNPILQENAGAWQSQQDKKLSLIQGWELDAVMVRGRQCLYNDKVYSIILGHTVTDLSHTPDIALSLYRPVPVVQPGQRYPDWGSIGHLDSENFWAQGEQVYHNGKEWISRNPANIWEPGAVGSDIWEEIGGEAEEPNPGGEYDDVIEWDSGQHWSTYTIGDLRKCNGAVYECKDPQWAQSYAPDTTAGLQYGWTKIADL